VEGGALHRIPPSSSSQCSHSERDGGTEGGAGLSVEGMRKASRRGNEIEKVRVGWWRDVEGKRLVHEGASA
jgi:hypothetical protein